VCRNAEPELEGLGVELLDDFDNQKSDRRSDAKHSAKHAENMADEAPTEAGGVSKTACKKAADDAGKAAKKKPDPEGLALIEQAKEAYAAKDLEKAFALYKEAEEKCKNSTMV